MTIQKSEKSFSSLDLLKLYVEFGVDETIGHSTLDHSLISNSSSPQQNVITHKEIYDKSSPLTNVKENYKNRLKSINTLAELKDSLQELENISIRKTAKSLVFGGGNPDSNIMIIGEAPGSEEDLMGLPFVGSSGKLLDKMLISIGLDREKVYITNILPWRPPGNRTPTKEEVSICLPYLERHIKIINPKIILMLGALSARTLLKCTEGITKIRGKWSQISISGVEESILGIATFHPAYLLRTPHQKRLAWRDMILLKEKYLSHMR